MGVGGEGMKRQNGFINLQALKAVRLERFITQEQIAIALGMKTPGGYSLIESGKRCLLATDIPIIAKAIGMHPVELSRLLFSEYDLTKCQIRREDIRSMSE
jgi:hypothetical protein